MKTELTEDFYKSLFVSLFCHGITSWEETLSFLKAFFVRGQVQIAEVLSRTLIYSMMDGIYMLHVKWSSSLDFPENYRPLPMFSAGMSAKNRRKVFLGILYKSQVSYSVFNINNNTLHYSIYWTIELTSVQNHFDLKICRQTLVFIWVLNGRWTVLLTKNSK